MPTNIMHPALSKLISLENIPNDAEGLGSAISSVFDDVFVKDLIFGLSPKGDAGFYTLPDFDFMFFGDLHFFRNLKTEVLNKFHKESEFRFGYFKRHFSHHASFFKIGFAGIAKPFCLRISVLYSQNPFYIKFS